MKLLHGCGCAHLREFVWVCMTWCPSKGGNDHVSLLLCYSVCVLHMAWLGNDSGYVLLQVITYTGFISMVYWYQYQGFTSRDYLPAPHVPMPLATNDMVHSLHGRRGVHWWSTECIQAQIIRATVHTFDIWHWGFSCMCTLASTNIIPSVHDLYHCRSLPLHHRVAHQQWCRQSNFQDITKRWSMLSEDNELPVLACI